MTSRTRPRRALAVLALLPALLASTGCGSSTGDAESDYAVMTWAPSGTGASDRPGVTALADLIGRAVNSKGGLNGHHLKVLTCNEHNTADGGNACVHQAVQQKVIAVIGSYSLNSDALLSGLEAAKIPYIGGYGLTSAEFTSPLSYPVAGGTPALVIGNGRQLIAAGCRTVALVRPDTMAGDALTGYLAGALKPEGGQVVDVRVNETTPDYAAAARKALGDDRVGNCVSDTLAPGQSAGFLDAYRRLNAKHTQLGAVIGSVPQSALGPNGAADGVLDNAYVTSWYPPTSGPAWDALRSTVGGNPIDVSDPAVQTTWVAYRVFLAAADRLHEAGKPMTSLSLREELESGDSLDTGGVTPQLSWSETLPSAESPRLVNTWVTFQQVKAGQLVEQQSGYLDMRWAFTGGQPPE
ncbi:ABC transporter substrate-binding protein [Kitasatospora sp. RB6PN24]|uniref:ABC transporter substrate-binding protein n=1 Tax=Kitasatospora humi TaxID=2893891 RepID=UPI001E5B99F3|nr:ABC transporter substrate-binding protein [Kitasatospora humi]MCC9311789.1 ABC transporter substrate-binding protein [Kitasatospora humi]